MEEPTLNDIRMPFVTLWSGVPLAAFLGLCAYLVVVVSLGGLR